MMAKNEVTDFKLLTVSSLAGDGGKPGPWEKTACLFTRDWEEHFNVLVVMQSRAPNLFWDGEVEHPSTVC